MPFYFGREMTDEEYGHQIVADDEALRFVRLVRDAEHIRGTMRRIGVSDEMWEETVARAERYLDD